MTAVLAICSPSADLSFGERVRALVHDDVWDLESPEGMALMQSVLRTGYPFATVVPSDGILVPTRSATVVLEVQRDGGASGSDLAAGWIAAAYDRHISMAYNLALRVLGDSAAAETVVEQAFLAVAASTAPAVPIESVGRSVRNAVCRFAVASLRARPPVSDSAPAGEVAETAVSRVASMEALTRWRGAERRLSLATVSEGIGVAEGEVATARAAYQVATGRGRPV